MIGKILNNLLAKASVYIIHKENIKSINHKEHKEITQSTLRNQDFVNFVNLAKRSHESKTLCEPCGKIIL